MGTKTKSKRVEKSDKEENEVRINSLKIKTKRGYGKKNKRKNNEKNINLTIIGANANGLKAKKESLFNIINEIKPSIITIQETKLRKSGQIKIPGYQNFERVRTGISGGGLLTSVLEDLNPVLIATSNDEAEIITVEANLGTERIRVINAYGPQEDDETQHIHSFWQQVEEQVLQAKDDNCFILIQMDANAKVGNEIIKGDPHKMSNNGRILLDIVKRQNLQIANSQHTCKGTITRQRILENKTEQSVIDFVIICAKLFEYLLETRIDEDKVYALSRHIKTKNGPRTITSDHNTIFSKFSISFNKQPRRIRKEYFQYKCEEGKKLFFNETSSTTKLSSCFEGKGNENVLKNANKFYKTLKGMFQKCFKKVRVRNGNVNLIGTNSIQTKMSVKKQLQIFLKNNTCKIAGNIARKKIVEIESALTKEASESNFKTVKDHISTIETLEGKFSQLGWWKLKQKLFPIQADPPMAKKDKNGNLVSAPGSLKNLYLETYKNRLRHRKMKEEYLDVFYLKSELWRNRFANITDIKTPPWEMKHLNLALKSLKNNKSMDPNGMINELFKDDYIGDDLKRALLSMFNAIKNQHVIPSFMNHQNITTIYKNKGPRSNLENDRGIFIMNVMKKVLDKLLYADNYEDIDQHMSDSNVGSRKKRNSKDHLLIIHGVINSVVNGNEDCVDIQIYDLEKAFDSLWLEDCLNDIFDNTSEDNHNDKLSLLYQSNKDNLVAVKTAVGLTDRINIPAIVQQGGTWGPLLCSNSVDSIGKKCKARGEHIYLYKNISRVLPLAFIDDLQGVAKCGIQSLALNTFLTTQIELKKLRFHVADKQTGKSKCYKMHVGKNNSFCPNLKVHGTHMQEVTEVTYLGDILSADGKNSKNISERISKGLGIISQIFNLLDNISFGSHLFEIAVLLRNSMLINGILTNAEIWYNLSRNEINEFEKLDKLFFCKLFEVPKSTPYEAFYLELGVLPINVLIKARRIMYLFNILNQDKRSMLYSFFITQWNNPSKGDWTEYVKQDLKDFKIPQSFKLIQSKSKYTFKKIVKTRAEELALTNLMEIKNIHSKLDNLSYNSLTMQNYLKSKEQPSIKRTIFKFRTRMARFGENFRGQNGPIMCPLCQSHLDNQSMSFQCKVINEETEIFGKLEDIYMEHIDENTISTLEKIMNIRREKLGN